jgi:hypothetical protein
VQRGVAAKPHPRRADLGIDQEAQQPGVVIAQQVDGIEVRQRPAQQQVEDSAALQPSVDVVADVQHDLLGTRGQLVRIRGDPAVQKFEQIGAAVDVADRIDAHARRYSCRVTADRRCQRPGFQSAAKQAA